MTDDTTAKPPLPEPFGVLGLLIGFFLAAVYYRLVIAAVPNALWPAHFVLLVFIVPIFLGVPVVFEKIYWRLEGDTKGAARD